MVEGGTQIVDDLTVNHCPLDKKFRRDLGLDDLMKGITLVINGNAVVPILRVRREWAFELLNVFPCSRDLRSAPVKWVTHGA